MKKNKLFIIGLVTVFVALLSLTLVSSTFAKYVTTNTGISSARVAKWGVTITSEGEATFAKEYGTDDASVKSTIASSVVSSNVDAVVAPGTKGQFAAVSISGTPEVAVKIERKATVTLEGWTIKTGDKDEFYCPIVIKVTKGGTSTEIKQGATINSAEALKKAIEDALNESVDVAANTDLSNELTSLTVTWEWTFKGDDTKDTALGSLTTAPTIKVEIVTSVTQIN